MNLLNNRISIESNNPQGLDYIRQQQSNQELTLVDNSSYIILTTCLFESIVRDYSNKLLPRDIIFFVQLLNLYSAALNKQQKTIIYSSEKLAKLLGYKAKDKNNMRSIVLRIVKKLEQLGLVYVIRSKNKKGSDKVNEIVPILPDHLYAKIKYELSNFNLDNRKLVGESNIQHILRTKLFTPMDLEFIKSLFDDATITATHKIFYLNCIITAYKNYQTTGKLSFSATSQELMSSNNISRATLFNILHFIKNQYSDYFIEVNHSYSKSDDIDSNKYDKSTFIIFINPIVIPKSFLNKNNLEIQKEIEQTKKVAYVGIDNTSLVVDNETEKPDTYNSAKTGVQIWKPSRLNLEAHNNKEKIIKESNKNIDVKNEELDKLDENNQIKPQTFLQTSNSEYLENELCSLSSKSLKNILKGFMDALPLSSNATIEDASRTIKNISDRKNKIEKTEKSTVLHPKASNDNQNKELRHFYPLSEKDVSILNLRANREFSVNFVNQLLLKLYIKYPEKRFKNKFTFLSYMQKALKNEKHQGPLVNHTTFRFSCNIGTQEKNILEYEKYLNEIEHSFDTSKEIQLKKKISGRFSTEIAYKILTQVEFKTNAHNSLITALIPSRLDLSERQIEILSEQLEAVYGINGYYVTAVGDEDVNTEYVGYAKGSREKGKRKEELERQYSKIKESDIITNNKDIGSLESSKELDKIEENTVWNQIRQGLRGELGEAIDEVWFSRAEATECRETGTLTLTIRIKLSHNC